ncbi:NAD-dependent epimerase/dehydratase family protein [Actinomycetospora lemnae]|uniref:NAD(P)-dependent oxidoreductase n=1 Tax=Actinomycetospora lemnae TaxID=3019891 RepID=A0ABT5SY37_9PSEU|nr:NAD(P)-dependent oxidoreductase [Actinomycetospora sp. DW7H6]MDD7967785.1 NAD(P)-dependent oxidoreductase [Actinomycetospora sp. DW7H6]
MSYPTHDAPDVDVPLPRHHARPRHFPEGSPHRSEWVGRRVLVTGARGFIGRHLTDQLLEAGAEVHTLVRPDSRPPLRAGWTEHLRASRQACNLTDPDDVRHRMAATAPEVVFHLASRVEGTRDADLVGPMLEDNVRSAVNVMAAACALDRPRVVLSGSVEEPREPGEAPSSPYAAAKAAATGYARLFHLQWDLPVTVLRLAMVYGPAQPDSRKLVPHVITSMLAGQVPRLGSGRRIIDWVYIDDVCEALMTAATHPGAPGLVADIGSGTGISIADTVPLLAELIGYDGPLGFGAIDDRRHDRALIADLAEATTALDWSPLTSLESGLARTVHWYRSRAAAAACDG